MNQPHPVLLLGVVAVAFAAGWIGVSNLVGPRRPNPTKLGAYESGNEPLADVPETRFSVKFYMVAMLFLIFDVEAVFVYPWAVVLRELGWAGLWQMVVFLGILGVCLVFEHEPLNRSAGIGQTAASSGTARDTSPIRFCASMWMPDESKEGLRSLP